MVQTKSWQCRLNLITVAALATKTEPLDRDIIYSPHPSQYNMSNGWTQHTILKLILYKLLSRFIPAREYCRSP